MSPLLVAVGADAPARIAPSTVLARVLVWLFVLLLCWRAPDGDELEAAMSTLKAGDVVEFRGAGTLGEFSGKLTSTDEGDLRLAGWMVRTTRGTVGRRLDALRIIERAPEPEPELGADIPDEVVEAAVEAATREWDSGRSVAYSDALRAALAAADAKRAELEGQA